MRLQRKVHANPAGEHAYQHQGWVEEDETLVYQSHMPVTLSNRLREYTWLSHPLKAEMLSDANDSSIHELDLGGKGRS